MLETTLRRRICIVQTVHLLFAITLFLTGVTGLVLLGLVIGQPFRGCPVVNIVYTAFWLCLALAILQTSIACITLIWFAAVSCRCHDHRTDAVGDEVQQQVSRTVTGAMGRSGGFFPKRNQLSLVSPYTVNGSMLPTTSTIASSIAAPTHVGQTGQAEIYTDLESLTATHRSNDSDTSSKMRTSFLACFTTVGWLQVLTIFVVALVIGQVVGLILSLNFSSEVDQTFYSQLTNIFIETKTQALIHSTPMLGTNRANTVTCWDVLQQHFRCCGADTYLDWLPPNDQDNLTTTQSPTDTSNVLLLSIPHSCDCSIQCTTTSTVHLGSRFIFTRGCVQPVTERLSFYLDTLKIGLGIVLFLIFITFVCDLVFTLWTAHLFVNELRAVRNEQVDFYELQNSPSCQDNTDLRTLTNNYQHAKFTKPAKQSLIT